MLQLLTVLGLWRPLQVEPISEPLHANKNNKIWVDVKACQHVHYQTETKSPKCKRNIINLFIYCTHVLFILNNEALLFLGA